jgi:hypothetical protein
VNQGDAHPFGAGERCILLGEGPSQRQQFGFGRARRDIDGVDAAGQQPGLQRVSIDVPTVLDAGLEVSGSIRYYASGGTDGAGNSRRIAGRCTQLCEQRCKALGECILLRKLFGIGYCHGRVHGDV